MDGNLNLWPDSYSDLCSPMGADAHDMDSGDIHYLSPITVGFVHSQMPINFLHPEFDDTSYARNTISLSPPHVSTGQRNQATGLPHIITDLRPDHVSDSESSTSSFFGTLPTPCSQFFSGLQPSVYSPSPRSALAENGMLMPEPEKVSPSLHHSPSFEGVMPDDRSSSLPMDTDVVTRVQMPHIIEWKRVIELCATNDFVPQTVYQPYTEADRKRYIRDVELHGTIFFCSEDSSQLGISLDDVLKQRLRDLKDKDNRMFVGCGPSVSIRIQWPGYAPWSKQIPTMDFKTPKGHITRAKLAKNIATCVRRFADVVRDKPMEAESDGRWKIGQRHIRAEDLILVSLHHVSKGSWQPQLRLRSSTPAFGYGWDEPFPLI